MVVPAPRGELNDMVLAAAHIAGVDKVFQKLIPGAAGQPHTILSDAGHFLQEDVGPDLAGHVQNAICVEYDFRHLIRNQQYRKALLGTSGRCQRYRKPGTSEHPCGLPLTGRE